MLSSESDIVTDEVTNVLLLSSDNNYGHWMIFPPGFGQSCGHVQSLVMDNEHSIIGKGQRQVYRYCMITARELPVIPLYRLPKWR